MIGRNKGVGPNFTHVAFKCLEYAKMYDGIVGVFNDF